MGSSEEGKLVTTTIHAYDIGQLKNLFRSQAMGVGMMGVMHIYFKYTNPLIIQSIIPLKARSSPTSPRSTSSASPPAAISSVPSSRAVASCRVSRRPRPERQEGRRGCRARWTWRRQGGVMGSKYIVIRGEDPGLWYSLPFRRNLWGSRLRHENGERDCLACMNASYSRGMGWLAATYTWPLLGT